MFEQVGDFEKAKSAYEEGAAIAEAVHKEHPEIVQALRNTTSSHWYIGQLFDREGDHQRALEEYSFSLKTVLDAIAADPTVDSARYGETKYSIVVGESMCRVGRKTEGLRLIHRGMDILRNYVASDKGDTQGSYYGSELMWWAVEGLVLAGQTEEARNVCLDAIKWVEQTAGMSDDPNPWLRLPVWYEELGDISASYDPDTHKIKSRDRVRLKEAKQDYQKAFDVLRDSTAKYRFSVVTIEDREKAVQDKIDECDSQLGL
jgi:tetratricopeptide (TPR) repeat protein